MNNDLSNMLGELGFAPQEQVYSCMAEDPDMRRQNRKNCRTSYMWFGLMNTKGQLLVETFSVCIWMPDHSFYQTSYAFPEITYIGRGNKDKANFSRIIIDRMKALFPDQEITLKVTMESAQPIINKALREPLRYGRGTETGLRNWLLQLTNEERELLYEVMEDRKNAKEV